jgi:hypothetical protein
MALKVEVDVLPGFGISERKNGLFPESLYF